MNFDPAKREARQAVVLRVIERATPSTKRTLSHAFSGLASPRVAIKAQCLVCQEFKRDAIRNCTGWSCPLWQYRPFQEAASDAPAGT